MSKWVFSRYGIGFSGAGSWSFGSAFPRNVFLFGFNNSSSSNTSNRKNNFLVLSERLTDDITDSSGFAKTKV